MIEFEFSGNHMAPFGDVNINACCTCNNIGDEDKHGNPTISTNTTDVAGGDVTDDPGDDVTDDPGDNGGGDNGGGDKGGDNDGGDDGGGDDGGGDDGGGDNGGGDKDESELGKECELVKCNCQRNSIK